MTQRSSTFVDAAERVQTKDGAARRTAESTPEAAGPSPVLFFETANAYQKTAALKAGIDLGLFTAIAEGAGTPAEIAAKCAASERGARTLSDFLVVAGFLTKSGSSYGLTQDSAVFLDRRSPAYLGGAMDFLLPLAFETSFMDLATTVRNGGTLMQGEGSMAPEHPMWVRFARGMAPLMMMPARAIAGVVNGDAARPLKVLDIAASHGLFGIEIARQNPRAQIVALDWANVLEVARENAEKAGVADRFRTIAGSAFEVDFGGPYDAVLLPNFLHHFDPPTNEVLLRKVLASLAEGGRSITLEFVPNEDRVSPPIPASFSLTMLATTPHGDAYTGLELEEMHRNAGFARCEVIRMDPAPQSVVIGYRER